MRLDFLVTKGPLVPSNSTICPRNGPKRRQKAQKLRNVHQHPETKNGPYLGLRGSNRIPRAPSPPATPTFYRLHPSESPNETRRPPYQWSLGAAGGPASPRTVGPTVGPPGSPGRKKSFFPKLLLDHLGCSDKCFWAILSPWWPVLGHGKSQNALKMGHFGTNNGSKMGQKRVFPKMILDHL